MRVFDEDRLQSVRYLLLDLRLLSDELLQETAELLFVFGTAVFVNGEEVLAHQITIIIPLRTATILYNW